MGVLMRVHWDDPRWRLWIGRKRQVIKLMMELLLHQGVIRIERYVTHDDDLLRLETVNAFGNPLQVDVRLATQFLSSIMDRESIPTLQVKDPPPEAMDESEKVALREVEEESLRRSLPSPPREPEPSPL